MRGDSPRRRSLAAARRSQVWRNRDVRRLRGGGSPSRMVTWRRGHRRPRRSQGARTPMHGIRGLLARLRRITGRRAGGAGTNHRTPKCWKGLNLRGMLGARLDGIYAPLERGVFGAGELGTIWEGSSSWPLSAPGAAALQESGPWEGASCWSGGWPPSLWLRGAEGALSGREGVFYSSCKDCQVFSGFSRECSSFIP